MSSLKDRYFPVLDHGFVALVDHLGDDAAIERAARVSFGLDPERQVSSREGLIRYLVRHRHTSPLEQGEIVFHLGLPLFVAQHLLRHRTANLNQESHRYTEPQLHVYLPETWKLQSQDNKQGSGVPLEDETARRANEIHARATSTAVSAYQELIGLGTSREQSRCVLPHGTYTMMYYKLDVHNLMHFLKLRCDEEAQWETAQFGRVMAAIVQELFPLSFQAWFDYVWGAKTFSLPEMKALRLMIGTGYDMEKAIARAGVRLDAREKREFEAKLRAGDPPTFSLPERSLAAEEAMGHWRRID